MLRKRLAVALAVVAVAALVANAAVFVYYPATVEVYPQQAPVVFQNGTNAGSSDLNGNTITVDIGVNGTNASIAVHPTYGYNYYYDILKVANNAGQAYYVNFYVKSSNVTDVGIAEAYIVIDGQKYAIPTTGTILPYNIVVNAGASLSIGFLFYTPDGAALDTNNKAVIDLYLIYSPVNETVPPLP